MTCSLFWLQNPLLYHLVRCRPVARGLLKIAKATPDDDFLLGALLLGTLAGFLLADWVVRRYDTQFGGVGPEEHSTERRLTGKVQQMMSDPKLRGRVIWLLMTARIHLLSPDIRRPGRVGESS